MQTYARKQVSGKGGGAHRVGIAAGGNVDVQGGTLQVLVAHPATTYVRSWVAVRLEPVRSTSVAFEWKRRGGRGRAQEP